MKRQIEQYNDEMAALEKRKKELEELKLKELEKSETVRLAEYLHDALCTSNHMDDCGWGYTTWENTNLNDRFSARAEYYKKAEAMLETGIPVDDITKIISLTRY